MKLQCDALVQRRGSNAGRRRATKSIVTLAKTRQTNTNKYEMVVSTPNNRNGLVFLLNSTTVSSIQTRFTNDGRASVLMAEPRVDVLISKAPPDRLRRFLALISSVLRGENVDLDEKRGVKSTDFVAEPVQLEILKSSQYPTPPHGFSSKLKELRIVGVRLRRIDGRWFGLSSLETLDLHDNLLGEAPDFPTKFLNITRLRRLKLLVLASNRITNITQEQWLALPTSLLVLNISDNQLTGALSPSVIRLERLAELNAGKNQLDTIPSEICRMASLRVLRLANNALRFVPATVRSLHLDLIDMAGNTTLFAPFEPYSHVPNTVASLLHIATAYVHNRRLPIRDLPWDLRLSMKDDTVICWLCKRFTPWDSTTVQFSRLDLSMISHTVSRGMNGEGSHVLAHYHYCRNCSKYHYDRC